MVETIQGKVQAMSDTAKGYGVRVDDEWYNGFGRTTIRKDDYVKITYVVNSTPDKDFNNIKTMRIVDEDETDEGKTQPLTADEQAELSQSVKPKRINVTPEITFDSVILEQTARMKMVVQYLKTLKLDKEIFPDQARMANNLLIISNREYELARKARK